MLKFFETMYVGSYHVHYKMQLFVSQRKKLFKIQSTQINRL